LSLQKAASGKPVVNLQKTFVQNGGKRLMQSRGARGKGWVPVHNIEFRSAGTLREIARLASGPEKAFGTNIQTA
jgi:hypothetical protein